MHAEDEGGGVTVLIPSLNRERQTTQRRLDFDPTRVRALQDQVIQAKEEAARQAQQQKVSLVGKRVEIFGTKQRTLDGSKSFVLNFDGRCGCGCASVNKITT